MADSLIRSEARTLARLRIRDTSTVNPGISDASLNLLIEDARQFYAAMYPEQMTRSLGDFNTVDGTNPMQVTITAGSVMPREISSVYYTELSVTPNTHKPLRFAPTLEDLRAELFSLTGRDQPKSVFAVRSSGSDNVFDLYMSPTPDDAYTLNVWGRFEPPLLTGDSDKLLFGFHGSRVIARIAALSAARVIGLPEDFVRGIEAELPDRVATRVREDAQTMNPLAYPGKART